MDSLRFAVRSSSIGNMDKTVREFNSQFKKSKKIILEICNTSNNTSLHYFLMHIKCSLKDFEDKVIIDCYESDMGQVNLYIQSVFDQKQEIQFKRKVNFGIRGPVIVLILVCFGVGYRWANKKYILPLIQQQKEIESLKNDTLPLIKYCIIHNWPTNRINFIEIAKQVRTEAEVFNIDRYIIYSVIGWESEFQASATHTNIGYDGNPGTVDYGLMQVNLVVNGKLYYNSVPVSSDIIFKPEVNIYMGSWLLSEDLKRANGNIVLALKYYNGCENDAYSCLVLDVYIGLNKYLHEEEK